MKTKSGLSRSFLKFKSVRTNHIEQCATSHIIEMVDELADPPLRTNNRRELPTFPRISTKSEADSKKLHPPPPQGESRATVLTNTHPERSKTSPNTKRSRSPLGGASGQRSTAPGRRRDRRRRRRRLRRAAPGTPCGGGGLLLR